MVLVTSLGRTFTLGKWANDMHPGFDAVLGCLRSRCERPGELLREAQYEPLPIALHCVMAAEAVPPQPNPDRQGGPA